MGIKIACGEILPPEIVMQWESWCLDSPWEKHARSFHDGAGEGASCFSGCSLFVKRNLFLGKTWILTARSFLKLYSCAWVVQEPEEVCVYC